MVYCVRYVSTHVKHLSVCRRSCDTLRNYRRDISNVSKCTCLFSVPENRHRLILQDLIHKDPDDIAIAIANILALSIHVMRPKDDELETKHIARFVEIHFDGVLSDAVWINRLRGEALNHWHLARPINSNRRS